MTSKIIGEHAIVLGGSMGGLLAARVLSEAYERVTVVERDQLPPEPEHRRGVPQSRHPHNLLPRGAEILDELFPGYLAELAGRGAPELSDYSRLHWSPRGNRLSAELDVPPVYIASRPLIETTVRERVRDLANVRILDGHEVVGLAATAGRDRVTGVRVLRRGAQVERQLRADLVVDALGRGARTPAWLSELGFDRPHEEKVPVNVKYTSQLVRLPSGAVPEQLTFIGATPERPTGMGLFAYENDTWLFTVAGYGGQNPKPDKAEMLAWIKPFTPEHIVAALAEAEPLSDVATFAFPAHRRRRYDQLRRFPHGLLVFGDAICSFNPTYGQGMTVAALEALALRRCLRQGERNLSRRFFRAAAKPVGVAWAVAVGGDLALPQVPGRRPLGVRMLNAYLARLLAAAEHDGVLATRFARVAGFVEAPPKLMTPAMMARVAVGTRRARVEATPVPSLAEA